jgi:type II secretory pathway component PulF
MSELFTLWLAGWREWLSNWQAYVLFFTVISVGLLVICYKRIPEEQEPVEISGLEAFTPEYMEMYQTGLWLLLHKETTPYDDL